MVGDARARDKTEHGQVISFPSSIVLDNITIVHCGIKENEWIDGKPYESQVDVRLCIRSGRSIDAINWSYLVVCARTKFLDGNWNLFFLRWNMWLQPIGFVAFVVASLAGYLGEWLLWWIPQTKIKKISMYVTLYLPFTSPCSIYWNGNKKERIYLLFACG